MVSRRHGRASAAVTISAPLRTAIYCRKSTTQGLDSNFSSIDNQREAAEAYAASQRHLNWTVLPDHFDDGGFSGGTTDRPALQRLLAGVERGEIDCVLVYKLDRLSRSLFDFLNLHRFLEKHGVAIVSVTEPIDTRTPMGRAFVNILMSFGQMERELAGERTRHKLHAARRRGKFVGGHPMLGYDCDLQGGRLIVNDAESEMVREIFRLFIEKRSLVPVAQILNQRGWTLKRWTTRSGKEVGGGRFNRTNLHRLLTSQTYVGKVDFQGTVYDGEHEAIVSPRVFKGAQAILAGNRRDGGATHRNRHGALLRDLLRCAACDRAMTHAPGKAHGKLYRYYRCQGAQKNGAASCPTKPLKADRVEAYVVDQIRRIGASPELQDETFRQAAAQVKARRRGLKLESKRLSDDLARARADVERLVGAVSRITGPAADAVAAELAKAQERVQTLEARQAETAAELATVAAQDIDREAVARALAEFDPLWEVLLTPERERVLRLLIERVDYRGNIGELAITWRMAGFGELAAEVAP